MTGKAGSAESRVAVLVDCDNIDPAVLEHALQESARFGRVVIRRGYGTHATLARQWQERLVGLAFTPVLQYPFAPGKNTSDIALALDALELLVDDRADTFCLVTSDSDFAHLCRKLRERGAMVAIVGDSRSPPALRNACDQFFEWRAPSDLADPACNAPADTTASTRSGPPPAVAKRRPRFVVEAVSRLAADAVDGLVHLGLLGQYLRRTDPAFSPKSHGHAGLLEMLRSYDLLTLHQHPGGHWSVSLATVPGADANESLATIEA